MFTARGDLVECKELGESPSDKRRGDDSAGSPSLHDSDPRQLGVLL